jgi:hypothetical protein
MHHSCLADDFLTNNRFTIRAPFQLSLLTSAPASNKCLALPEQIQNHFILNAGSICLEGINSAALISKGISVILHGD